VVHVPLSDAAPLEEVGGIAIETVTEDAHTALKLNRHGYSTAYLNITQAAGLATESLSAHIGAAYTLGQRNGADISSGTTLFWERGCRFFQRLCYSTSMLHFFSGIPRLIFLTAPLCYLWFGMHIINTEAIYILIYAMPHIVLSSVANSRNQGAHRHSFWGEVYESVLAWYITLPTTVALFNPRLGKFNVTAKGGLVTEKFFDWTISAPYIILVFTNLLGIVIGIGRLLWWNAYEPGTVLLNLTWTLFNMIILGAAISVASESRQVRLNHRVAIRVPAILQLSDGRALHVNTQDYSSGRTRALHCPKRCPLLKWPRWATRSG
jgi:cellulose synthase (UDP-forming)